MAKKPVASHNGTRAVDVIRKRYMGERRCLVVKEWFDEDRYKDGLVMWFPPMTGNVMAQVADREELKTDFDRQLMLMVLIATDEGGSPLFRMGDVAHLKEQAEWTVLQRVFEFMLAPWMTKEDADKMIEEDPTSGRNSPLPTGSEKPSTNSAT